MGKSLTALAISFLTYSLTGSGPVTLGQPAANFPAVSLATSNGSLFLVGGGHTPAAVRNHFLQLAGGQKARIVIIPSASSEPDAPAVCYAYWKDAPVKWVRLLHTTRRSEADNPRFYGLLREATGVWFSGGDQNRLTALYRGTGVERELRNLLGRGGVVGGTSAGASVPCGLMMTGGPEAAPGFGLITGVTVDQHFSNRARLPRLLSVLRSHPEEVGIGIDESTAILIRGGQVSVLGEATVTVARTDGEHATVRVYHAGSRFAMPAPLTVASR